MKIVTNGKEGKIIKNIEAKLQDNRKSTVLQKFTAEKKGTRGNRKSEPPQAVSLAGKSFKSKASAAALSDCRRCDFYLYFMLSALLPSAEHYGNECQQSHSRKARIAAAGTSV